MGQPGDIEASRVLGAALRSARTSAGISLRALAHQIGLRAHGKLVEVEHGRRMPSDEMVAGYERALNITDQRLRRLRAAALSEQEQTTTATATATATTTASPPYTSTWRRYAPVLFVVALVEAVLLALTAGASAAISAPAAPPPSASVLRMSFEHPLERPEDHWSVFWGHQVARAEVTDRLAYDGTHSLLTTVIGASKTKGYAAVGTTHGLSTLRPGMTVTMHLWTSNPAYGVQFFVYDSMSKPRWAPQTPGVETPIPASPGWATMRWTVPPTDVVHGIGVQFFSGSDVPLYVYIDAVSW